VLCHADQVAGVDSGIDTSGTFTMQLVLYFQKFLEFRKRQIVPRLPLVQTYCGAQPASYLMGIGDPFPGGKAAGA
jgi:hypothetical protein